MTRTTSKPRLSTEQAAYALARAARDVMRKEIATAARAIPEGLPHEEYADRYEAICNQAGYYQHIADYQTCEQALLDWAHERIRQLPQYAAHRADMERLFRSPSIRIREKLIDTCMRLAA